jgi:hypothetical protein
MNVDSRQALIGDFIRALAWKKARRLQHTLKLDGGQQTIVWYETEKIGDNRTDCFLQVNELGHDKNSLYCSAAIYAPRFRICTGWHGVKLTVGCPPAQEAMRVCDWLHWQNMSSYRGRRAFRRRHPEAVGYSWAAIRSYGPPYRVQLQVKGGRKILSQRKSMKCKQVLAG